MTGGRRPQVLIPAPPHRPSLPLINADQLDLDATLHSGQAFRWRRTPDGWHHGWIDHRRARVRTVAQRLEFEGEKGLTAEAVRGYFRLEGGHERFLRDAPRDVALDAALAYFPGLRLLRQDPWELFISFIVSANSNVPKIQRTIESLAAMAGEAAPGGHRFPNPSALANLGEGTLRRTGMGYRAPYVASAALEVASGALDLEELRNVPYEAAHQRLLQVDGVGPKVADCILLYGLDRLEAFPVDVWVDRILRESYFPRRRLNYAQAGEFARRHFGAWTGYSQHFLFHYRRTVGTLPKATVAQAARRRLAANSSTRRPRTTLVAGGNSIPR